MGIKGGGVSIGEVDVRNDRSRSIEAEPMGNWDGEGMEIEDGGWVEMDEGMDEGDVSMDMDRAGGFSDEENGFGKGMHMGRREERMDVEVIETNGQQKKLWL